VHYHSVVGALASRTFDEIRVGDTASLTHTLVPDDVRLVAAGVEVDPAHVEMWAATLISTLLATKLPGSILVSQSLRFRRAAALGDTLTVSFSVTGKDPATGLVSLECRGVGQAGDIVIEGTAEMLAPGAKIAAPRGDPAVDRPGDPAMRHRHLMALTQGLEPLRTAVVHPVDRNALLGAIAAAQARLIVPVLVGPEAKIRGVAAAEAVELGPYRLVPTRHSHEAAERAVAMARAGEVEALMKGSLHTDELMHEVVAKETGLRTARRISHVFVMDVPTCPRPLFITDAAINIAPDLLVKRDIVQNAIDLAQVLGVAVPKVAILSAVETPTPEIASTIDAAALCKMAERGQITGGVLDGPLAFDNAISEEAAKIKGIESPVAGRADVLVVPDLESGNMLAKQLEYLGQAQGAGIVLGARVPIVLTSRADSPATRTASCAVALVFARRGPKY
jgi:phosphate acetyltransferase/phosphate butyryltransferase